LPLKERGKQPKERGGGKGEKKGILYIFKSEEERNEGEKEAVNLGRRGLLGKIIRKRGGKGKRSLCEKEKGGEREGVIYHSFIFPRKSEEGKKKEKRGQDRRCDKIC